MIIFNDGFQSFYEFIIKFFLFVLRQKFSIVGLDSLPLFSTSMIKSGWSQIYALNFSYDIISLFSVIEYELSDIWIPKNSNPSVTLLMRGVFNVNFNLFDR